MDKRSPTVLPKPLGVGLTYQDGLRSFVEKYWNDFDYLEVVPDTSWHDRGAGRRPRYRDNPDIGRFLEQARSHVPFVAHSIGQSIGSADHFDRGHAKQIQKWHDRFGFAWHSDHLSYHLVDQGRVNVGFTLPLPRDRTSLRLLAPRVSAIRKRVPTAFLLETNVYFFTFPEEEMGEAEFLNRLCDETGCGLLLDLHNVYTNARNHHFDPMGFLDELDLSKVVEIHLAGGMEHAGFYLDAHSGLTPPEVWAMLDRILPRLTSLAGLTFEIFEDWIPDLDASRLREELARMRSVWGKRARGVQQ